MEAYMERPESPQPEERVLQVEALFMQALERDASDRAGFLEGIEDQEIAGEVRSLLQDFGAFDNMLDNQAEDSSQNFDRTLTANPFLDSSSRSNSPLPFLPGLDDDLMPETVGSYRILDKLGQGGMGSVYLARQPAPARDVALKIIPRHQVSKNFLARFEAEYQALALMTHHNIAHIFEAGSTPEGNPFFAMELVRGESITQYCHKNNLSINQRLRLFLQVCAGVQHAHQKGVIHRDLKPSNIMVQKDGGQAIVKIIDFGMAKSLDGALGTQTLNTEQGLAGTPAYMCPEQLEGRPDLSDTRGDIYSLGLILYELLAGDHPYDMKALRKLPLDEALKTLRTQDPIRPGKRREKLVAQKPDLSFPGRIGEDLDRVVLKAMAKEQDHRYSSAGALAEDIRCYLDHRPVSARSVGALGLFLRFVQRNKILVSMGAAAICALLAGLFLSISSSIKATRANNDSLATIAFLQEVLSAPNPRQSGRAALVVDVLEKAEQRLREEPNQNPKLTTAIHTTLGNTWFGLGLYDEAEPHLKKAWELNTELLGASHPETLRARYLFARLLRRAGKTTEAAQHFREVLASQDILLGRYDRNTLQTETGLAMTYRVLKDYESSESLFRDALDHQLRLFGPNDKDSLITMVGLANVCMNLGKVDEAETHYRRALDLQKASLGSSHPETLATMHGLANCLLRKGQYGVAEPLLRTLADLRESILGPMHPETVSSLYTLSRCLFRLNRMEEAESTLVDVVIRRREILGGHHQDSLRAVNYLARVWRDGKRYDEAEGLLMGALADARQFGNERDEMALILMQNLGDQLIESGEYMRAALILEHRLELGLAIHGPNHQSTLTAQGTLAEAYEKLGMDQQAFENYCEALDIALIHHPDSRLTQVLRKVLESFLLGGQK